MSAIPQEVLADVARAGMRRMAQGVCVVSALSDDGTRHAMTASSVTSVSMDPPSLLICVNQRTRLHPLLQAGAPFCVNVLSADMAPIASRCAGQAIGEARFELGDWREHGAPRVPYLADARVNLFCVPCTGLSHGTHLICVAAIHEVRLGDSAAPPLIYHDGDYVQ